MKTIKLFITVLFTVVLVLNSAAQTHDHSKMSTTKTETFKVSGECGMCKSRIEKSAKAEGVVSASWDVKTKMITVTFDPSKTSVDALSKKFASVGHDTEKYKADDKTYEALPACCHYDRTK